MAARSSGDRLVFIQGGGGAFSCEPACASRGIPRATTPRQSRSERKLRAREWAMRFPLGTCNWAQKNDFILLALRMRVLRGGDLSQSRVFPETRNSPPETQELRMEPTSGLEPLTCRLRIGCSTN